MRILLKTAPTLASVAVLALLAPAAATAQLEITSGAVGIHLNGRAHAQFRTTSVDGPRSSEFLLRRARFVADVTISDLVFGRVEPDFGEGEINLKDAYLRLNLDPAFRLSFGQFKRAFDIFELYSTTQILQVERSGSIDGVDACAGPGGVCSWSRLSEKLQYSARDIGVKVDGTAGDKLSYEVTMTNGTGANKEEQNGAKSYSGRVVVQATSQIALGANLGLHDYVHPTLANEYAAAYGGDIEIGAFGDEFHLQAGVMAGDNWLNLDANEDPATFVAVQGVVSYRFPITSGNRFDGVEPFARVSWADPNTDAVDSSGLLFTPGMALHITGRNMLVANVDVWTPAAGDAEWSFKFMSKLHF
jgi:hypothetical protein